MNFPLLATKLYTPARLPRLVVRLRLRQVLDEGLNQGRCLTLITAPAGFGKTTLLADWLAGQQGRRVAWLSLDADDNDLHHFLVYLVAACSRLEDAACRAAQALLQAPQPPAANAILAALINGLAEVPAEMVLVLDDLHVIEAAPPYEVLAYLIDHLPPRLHLVLAGRLHPAESGDLSDRHGLPLARLRARGQLTELGAADLRFTLEETSAFLRQAMGLELTVAEVAALEARTEGWIAGLQLAALSLKGAAHAGPAEAQAFLAAFTGSNRYVFDYLAEEVLRRQPEHIQSFLLQTSLLERLCGALCDAVLLGEEDQQDAGSQAILEYLEAANLFIVPLDDSRCWYRYHTLFAEFLRTRLSRLEAVEGPAAGADPWRSQLHRRAAQWLYAHGFFPEAIHQALAAPDFELAAGWIEQTDRLALMPGDTSLLLGWMDVLPPAFVRSRPRLSLLYAWALLTAGQVERVDAHIQDAVAATPRDQPILGEAACLRSILANLPGDGTRAIALAQEALATLPEGAAFLRALAALNLGLAYDSLGDFQASLRAYRALLAIPSSSDFPLVTVMALVQLADLHALQGDLGQAAALYRRAIEQAGHSGRPLNVVSMAHANLGWLLYEWNELDEAAQQLLWCIEQGRQWGSADMLATGLASLAHVRQAQGQAEAAMALAEQARQAITAPLYSASTALTVMASLARLGLKAGQSDWAAPWLGERQGPGRSAALRHLEETTRARCLLAQGNAAAAWECLDRLPQAGEEPVPLSRVIERHLLQARALAARGKPFQAVENIRRALEGAAPGGYIRLFVDEGENTRRLVAACTFAEEETALRSYAHRLLAAFGEEIFPQAGGRQELVEALSERELDVLRLIAAGLSNQEIAQRLVLALSTVKTHINNIYGKLGVESRVQGINRARELGLV